MYAHAVSTVKAPLSSGARSATHIRWRTPCFLSALLLSLQLPSVLAQNFTLEVPATIPQCTPTTVNWTGSTGPYTLYTVPTVLTPLDIPYKYPNLTGNSYVWTPNYDTEAFVLLVLEDSTGLHANTTRPVLVTGGADRSCIGPKLSTASPTSSPSIVLPAADDSTSGTSQSLSGGAIAGIVIGCVAGVSLAALWLARKYNQRRRRQAFRRGHKSKRSDWQALSEMPASGPYPFAAAKPAGEKSEVVPATPVPPSPPLQRPNEAAASVASCRVAVPPFPQEPPVSPFN
ncbi:hypothetical protein OH77DRAFT_1525278 [Trametes cingulata]|nr:hypothetical protein OH77DRAFT_1525278 [Trametes cingulata]